jgi:hypothetical protein
LKRALAWLLAAVVLAGGAFLLLRRPATPKRGPLPLVVHFTCDVRGRLVPCGCFTGQMGGLTRVGTLLDGKPAPGEIRVDVGDAIAGTADYEQIQHRYILRALGELGFDAANIGHREAALSAATLQRIGKGSPVPLISANLLDAATGAPVLATHRIVERAGWKIALIGVLDPKGLGEFLGQGLTVEKIETALGRLIPQLKGKADAIVLLAFADEEMLRKLARDFYEIDLILGGKVSQPAQRLEQENRSQILYVTNQSRALGTFTATLSAPSKLDEPNGDITLVSDRIPQAQRIGTLNREYRDEIRKTKLEIDQPEKLAADLVPGVKANASFVGSASCLACHAGAAQSWQHSQHSKAFASLIASKADADPNCIGCHTVGFGSASGYRREFAAQKFTDVGCESCHGPGGAHIAARQGGLDTGRMRALGAGDCQKCHHGEFSRPFVWEQFWPAVKHGK